MDSHPSGFTTNSSIATLHQQYKSSNALCGGSSTANTVRRMTERRQLTHEEKADAARLSAIYEHRKALAKSVGSSLTQEDVAVLCGWSGQSAFGQYVRGRVPLNLKALLLLSKALGVEPHEISPTLARTLESTLERSNVAPMIQPYRKPKEYPLISWVAAGSWAESCDNYQPGDADEMIESDENAGDCGYWLEVDGESMIPPAGAGFAFTPGMRILVKPENFDVINGKLYIALLDIPGGKRETTFKQYVRDAGVEYLRPLNPAFKTLEMDQHVQIIGRVIDARPPKSVF